MNFSLNWFKSEKKKELEALRIEEQILKNRLLLKELDKGSGHPTQPQGKLYSKLMLVDGILTVVFPEGELLNKSEASLNDFTRIKNATSVEEIYEVMLGGKEEMKRVRMEEQRTRNLGRGIALLEELDDFYVEGKSVYLRESGRTLPPLLVEKFAEIVGEYKPYNNDEDYDEGWIEDLYNDHRYLSLKRFFLWCCLNPRTEVADKLYTFLMKNSFRITRQGFFVGLRNVVSKNTQEDQKFVDFVSNMYQKVKAVWKRKPEEYRVVFRNDEYSIEKVTSEPRGVVIGNLDTLYKDLPDMAENRYTDDYTRTFDIRIGKVVSMPMKDCKWTTQDCAAAGLHFTSDEIHYVGCGDTSVLVLINPMKVVGIGEHKGRCYEYLPIMTVPREEATEILHDLDFDTLELDEDYALLELEDLKTRALEGFVQEVNKYEFNIPRMSIGEIDDIISSLDKMRREIEPRVIRIS